MTSLARVVDEMQVYEEMPIAIPEEMRRSVSLGLAASVVGLLLWSWIGGPLAAIFVPMAIVSLMLLGAFLVASWGMTKPVNAETQQMVWIASIPAGANAVGIITLIILAIVAVVIFLSILAAILGALALIGAIMSG